MMTREQALARINHPCRLRPPGCRDFYNTAIIISVDRDMAFVKPSGHGNREWVKLDTLKPWKAKDRQAGIRDDVRPTSLASVRVSVGDKSMAVPMDAKTARELSMNAAVNDALGIGVIDTLNVKFNHEPKAIASAVPTTPPAVELVTERVTDEKVPASVALPWIIADREAIAFFSKSEDGFTADIEFARRYATTSDAHRARTRVAGGTGAGRELFVIDYDTALDWVTRPEALKVNSEHVEPQATEPTPMPAPAPIVAPVANEPDPVVGFELAPSIKDLGKLIERFNAAKTAEVHAKVAYEAALLAYNTCREERVALAHEIRTASEELNRLATEAA